MVFTQPEGVVVGGAEVDRHEHPEVRIPYAEVEGRLRGELADEPMRGVEAIGVTALRHPEVDRRGARVVGLAQRDQPPGGQDHRIAVGEPAGRIGADLPEIDRPGPQVVRDGREIRANLS